MTVAERRLVAMVCVDMALWTRLSWTTNSFSWRDWDILLLSTDTCYKISNIFFNEEGFLSTTITVFCSTARLLLFFSLLAPLSSFLSRRSRDTRQPLCSGLRWWCWEGGTKGSSTAAGTCWCTTRSRGLGVSWPPGVTLRLPSYTTGEHKKNTQASRSTLTIRSTINDKKIKINVEGKKMVGYNGSGLLITVHRCPFNGSTAVSFPTIIIQYF